MGSRAACSAGLTKPPTSSARRTRPSAAGRSADGGPDAGVAGPPCCAQEARASTSAVAATGRRPLLIVMSLGRDRALIGSTRPVASGPVRLVIARCSVDYIGRLTAHLPMATRLLLVKADGSVSVHADDRAYKPLNWMSPPCWLTEEPDGPAPVWVVQNKAG